MEALSYTVVHCQLYGRPYVLAMWLIGDLGTFIAYMMIPIAILIVMNRRGVKFNALAAMFAAFIFSCGFGHLLKVVGIWYPIVEAEAIGKMLTALISLVAAAYAFKLIPEMCKFPTAESHHITTKMLEWYRNRDYAELERMRGKNC